MIGAHDHAQIIGWDGISRTFCLGWPQTMILLISTCQVATITGMNHRAQLWIFIFKNERKVKR
jgi:hypothetical protein